MGINCEKCINNYFRPFGVSPNIKEPCIPCECNPVGTVGPCTNMGGACTCKEGFVGQKCTECASGYSGPNCTKCACDTKGTMPGGECEAHCQCKVRKRNRKSSHFHRIFHSIFILAIFSCTLKGSSVISVFPDILACRNRIKRDAQNATALVWEMFARVAILLLNQ